MGEKRPDKVNYYLDVAEVVGERSTCLKRHYSCIIVNNDEVIASGYNGAPRKLESCLDKGKCNREKSERGRDYSECPGVHAEMNAIISSSRKDMIGADMYLVGIEVDTKSYVKDPSPCSLCKRMIINSGINRVFVRVSVKEYKLFTVSSWKVEDIIGGY